MGMQAAFALLRTAAAGRLLSEAKAADEAMREGQRPGSHLCRGLVAASDSTSRLLVPSTAIAAGAPPSGRNKSPLFGCRAPGPDCRQKASIGG